MPDPFLTAHPGRHTGAVMRARRERAGVSVEAIAAEIAGLAPGAILAAEKRKVWTMQAVTIYGDALKRICARRTDQI